MDQHLPMIFSKCITHEIMYVIHRKQEDLISKFSYSDAYDRVAYTNQ
jgi:hypothetical protein